jgi:hypothetical protein
MTWHAGPLMLKDGWMFCKLKCDNSRWTRSGRFEWLQEKLDTPGLILTFVGSLAYLAYDFGGWSYIRAVAVLILAAAIALGALFVFTSIVIQSRRLSVRWATAVVVAASWLLVAFLVVDLAATVWLLRRPGG